MANDVLRKGWCIRWFPFGGALFYGKCSVWGASWAVRFFGLSPMRRTRAAARFSGFMMQPFLAVLLAASVAEPLFKNMQGAERKPCESGETVKRDLRACKIDNPINTHF